MKVLKVLSGGAAHGLVDKVRPAFEKETGFTIDGSFGAVGGMKARLLGGEPADVMILSRSLIDELVHAGKVVASSVTDVARVTTAIAVRAGDPRPDVGDKAALRAALLAADEIHFPDPSQSTAGIHFGKVLKELGVWAEAESRLRPKPSGAEAMRALASSKAARPIGCTQETEIRAIPGIVVAAPLPPGCDLVTTYTAAVTTVARSPEPARRLIASLHQQGQ
ncbi:MAG TPA: substrate-binding domain-containing protein [Reyranella sp.]|nr:substrate-binding domain-containing protein [Reyranella sp.]